MSGTPKIIAFGTETEAIALKRLAWIATVEQAVDTKETAQDADENLVTDLSGLSADQIAALKILGRRDGELITDNGGAVIDYCEVLQAHDVEPAQYWIPAPIDLEEAGYIDLSEYSVIELNPAWMPPID